jgi:hypothetical protein
VGAKKQMGMFSFCVPTKGGLFFYFGIAFSLPGRFLSLLLRVTSDLHKLIKEMVARAAIRVKTGWFPRFVRGRQAAHWLIDPHRPAPLPNENDATSLKIDAQHNTHRLGAKGRQTTPCKSSRKSACAPESQLRELMWRVMRDKSPFIALPL